MIHAYDKLYLEKTQEALARMLDFAVYDLKYSLSDFWDKFLNSDISKKIEIGDCSAVVGRSGIELAYIVIGDNEGKIKPNFTQNRSVEYWTGWAVAYFQWRTGLKFKTITKYISIDEIAMMYSPYHEMDIRHFYDKMIELYRIRKGATNLKLRRKECGLSQKELAEQTGIPLRTIQQYEQGQKNINHAKAEYILILSRELCCDIKDLLEY